MPEPLSETAMNSLTEALLQGRKIEAIKIYRSCTGLGLKEAKEAIEELERSLRIKFPDKFSAPPKSAGCFGSAAVLCLGFCLVAYGFFAANG
jgi:hypothetical protein